MMPSYVYIASAFGYASPIKTSIRQILHKNGFICIDHADLLRLHDPEHTQVKEKIRFVIDNRIESFVILLGEDAPIGPSTIYEYETNQILQKSRKCDDCTCVVVVSVSSVAAPRPEPWRTGFLHLGYEDSKMFSNSLLRALGCTPTIVPWYQYHPQGPALIICNWRFISGGLANRISHRKDAVLFEEVARAMGLRPEMHINLTADQMRDKIMSIKKKISNDTMVAVLISSHGHLGHVYGIDGQSINIMQDVVAPFYRETCPELDGKLKLFCIQACQSMNMPQLQDASTPTGVVNIQPEYASTPTGVVNIQPEDASTQAGIVNIQPEDASTQTGIVNIQPEDASTQTGVVNSQPGPVFMDTECSASEETDEVGSPALFETMSPPSSPHVQETVAPLFVRAVVSESQQDCSNELALPEAAQGTVPDEMAASQLNEAPDVSPGAGEAVLEVTTAMCRNSLNGQPDVKPFMSQPIQATDSAVKPKESYGRPRAGYDESAGELRRPVPLSEFGIKQRRQATPGEHDGMDETDQVAEDILRLSSVQISGPIITSAGGSEKLKCPTAWLSDPTESDVIISYSTMPDSLSYETRDRGSFYVEALHHTVAEHGNTNDLADVFRHVSAKVKRNVDQMRQNVEKSQKSSCIVQSQEPYFKSTFNKKIKF